MTGMSEPDNTRFRTALITGGSAGLGLELARGLLDSGWRVVIDGRDPERLQRAVASLGPGETGRAVPPPLTAVAGNVADAAHRAALAERVVALGRLDLLVHNASALGPSPLRPLGALGPAELTALWTTNVVAANALNTLLVPTLRTHDGILVSISSDAAVEHYENWGGYGASKAALDHLTLTWSAEAGVTGYAVDPGDMRTAMHQLAFPGEDISDRPLPQTVVPRLLALLDQRPPSGRYWAAAFAPALAGAPA